MAGNATHVWSLKLPAFAVASYRGTGRNVLFINTFAGFKTYPIFATL